MALLLLQLGCHVDSKSPSGPRAELVIPVPSDADTITVEASRWPETVRTQGSLAADERSLVSAKVAGRVEETLAEFGDEVEQGQPLARLELSDFELQIQQADAELAEACAAVGLLPTDQVEQLDATAIPFVAVEKAIWDEAVEALERLRRLQRTSSVSESEFKKQMALERVAKARYESALRSVEEKKALIKSRRVALSLAKQNKEDATISAPFRGVIRERHLAVGTFVQAGTPVFTVVRVDPLRFRGRIPERKATSARVGLPITITVEGSDTPIETHISRISPSLDLASRSLQIEAEIPNPERQFRSGFFAEGLVEIDANATAISVPRSAIGEFAGVYKLWVVDKGNLVSRRVSLGREGKRAFEIVSGINTRDEILVDFRRGDAARRAAGRAVQSETLEKGTH